MKINEIIRSYRKRENLTQEQIASYLNVSAPAVNKWERGMSYPDITLLAPLARILKIDVNTLLEFNEELTDTEIKKFTKDIGEIATREGLEKAFEKGSDLIKEYPNCDELTFWISTVLRIYLLQYKGDLKDKYERKIINWLEIVASSAKEKIASMANLDLSAIYREKEDYQESQKMLDRIQEVNVDKTIQQALLFENSGKIDCAYNIWEKKIWENSQEIFTVLSFVIELLYKERKYSEAEEYIERAKKVAEVFDFGVYHKYSLDLSLAIEKSDKEKVIEMVVKMVNEASSMDDSMKSTLYKHMNFNITHPISKDRYEEMVKEAFKKNEKLNFVKNDPRIKSLLK